MRSFDEIRETAFIVARQYLAVEGARERPIGPVYQLHLDVLDLQIHAEADAERLAAKDAELHQLREDAGDEVDRLQALISAGEVEIRRLKTEIELWKTADSKAVATARRQIDKLWEALEGAWHQFAYVDGNGKRWCGGLSALEDMADALGLDV